MGMTVGDQGSITRWIGELKAGDRAAVQPLWERYFDRLVRLARARLRAARRSSGIADEEDAALSAFDSFCQGVERGRFPDLGGRDDLWRLLVVITARKVLALTRREARRKRGGGLVAVASDYAENSGDDGDLLDRVVGREPSPEFAALVAEEYRQLLEALGDESLRRVAVARMEGFSNAEIAARLGCAQRTVARRLDLIRKTWLAEGL
jgi:DNA-directed RNA polymerase specialized sigma24 family protein